MPTLKHEIKDILKHHENIKIIKYLIINIINRIAILYNYNNLKKYIFLIYRIL